MNKLVLIILFIRFFTSALYSQNDGLRIITHREWPDDSLYNKVEWLFVNNYCSQTELSKASKLLNLKHLVFNSYMGKDLYPLKFNFKHLETLHIINCPNLNIEEIFSQLTCDTTLKSIKIISCGIKKTPCEIYEKFRNLEELVLRNNKIETIEKDFACANSLQYLNLSDNKLESISINWGLYTNLKKLYISNNKKLLNDENKMNAFCKSISGLNIEFLFMKGMNIKHFPCCLKDVPLLYNLHLNDNLIKILPECGGFEKLEILNLVGNKVFDVPKIFERQARIKSVY